MLRTRFQFCTFFLLISIGLFSQRADGFFDGTDERTFCVMERAERQIEKVRKGDFKLEFQDVNGNKIDAMASVELKAHEFDFGTDLFGFHKMDDSNPAKVIALKAIDSVFNTVIVCDYWGVNQSKLDGALDWESPDYGLSIAEQHSKRARYHALIFGFPRWLHNYETEEEQWAVIEERIKNVANRYGDQITEVDVINEFINYQYWDQNPHALYLQTTTFPDFAKAENGVRILEIARKHLPNTKLVVLETNIWSTNNPVYQEIYRYHKSLIAQGAPYDYIGYQAHYYAQGGMPFHEGTPEFGPRTFMMDEISKGLEKMSELGKPIVITEFNPPSRNNRSTNPDQPGLSDEEIAAWESNFYTLVFSKPYMKGISRWFTIDNLGGKGMDAGVVTEEGILKPNYFALKALIKEKWHTKWTGGIDGQVAFNGYYGTYLVKIEGREDLEISITAASRKQTIVVK